MFVLIVKFILPFPLTRFSNEYFVPTLVVAASFISGLNLCHIFHIFPSVGRLKIELNDSFG